MFVFLQYGSHSKKRPDNLVIGRTYDHHIYDLVEVGAENFKPMESFSYDKKLAPKEGSKPFIVFIGEGFEAVEELKHLKEVLLDLLRGEVCDCCFSWSGSILFTVGWDYINRSDVMDCAGCGELKSCWSGPCICMCCPFSKPGVFYALCITPEKVGQCCAEDGIGRSWPFHGFCYSSDPSS